MNSGPVSTLETTLITFLENGKTPTLADLGGLAALQQAENELSCSPLLSEIIHLLFDAASSDENNRELLLELAIRLAYHIQPLYMEDVVNDIHACRFLVKKWEGRFFQFFLDQAVDQLRDPLSRSFALDGAFRYVKDQIPERHALLAKLTAVDEGDDPYFLRHAAKIIGVAFSWWRSEGLVDRLKAIVNLEEAGDEASFELGMAALVEGLNAFECEAVRSKFLEAQQWFELTLEKREHRPDATLLSAALQAWSDFAVGATSEALEKIAQKITQEAFVLLAWHDDENAPFWRRARFSEQSAWHLLALRLASLASRLGRHSWLDARSVIEQELIFIITANRTILGKKQAGGLELLGLPRISSGLQIKPGLIQHLQEWLVENPKHPDADAIGFLLKHTLIPQPSNDDQQQQEYAPLYCSIKTPKQAEKNEFIKNLLSSLINLSSPSLVNEEPILEQCREILQDVDDFNNQKYQKIFCAVLLITIRYLISTMSLTKQHAPFRSFLFKPTQGVPLPTEDKLQQDYYNFLASFLSSGSVQIEQSNIASGRADIFLTVEGYYFVIEVKRELSNASFDNIIESYASQTTEYQNTGIRLGILLVLDLTEKKHGVAHVTEQVQAYAIQRVNEKSKRGIVIVRIPGNKLRPSEL